MKEQLDLVKILKDCPKGMELDCTMYDNVTLKSVSLDINNSYPICIETKHGFDTKLTKYGQNICIDDAKCVIFPKGKTTWKGFQRPFVDGDIVINKNNIGTWIGIYHKDDRLNETFSSYCYIRRDGIFCANSDNNHGYYETRLATKEEKEKFFQAIKDNGYKWNVETKTLEKLIVPRFKIRDKIKHKNDKTIITIIGIKDDYYYMQFYNARTHLYQNEKVLFKDQDQYELIPNKFDPKTLKPFDKVLVRDIGYSTRWHIQFFETMYEDKKKYPFVCLGGKIHSYCIPYNDDTKHLLNTINEPSEFYKYWEN